MSIREFISAVNKGKIEGLSVTNVSMPYGYNVSYEMQRYVLSGDSGYSRVDEYDTIQWDTHDKECQNNDMILSVKDGEVFTITFQLDGVRKQISGKISEHSEVLEFISDTHNGSLVIRYALRDDWVDFIRYWSDKDGDTSYSYKCVTNNREFTVRDDYPEGFSKYEMLDEQEWPKRTPSVPTKEDIEFYLEVLREEFAYMP